MSLHEQRIRLVALLQRATETLQNAVITDTYSTPVEAFGSVATDLKVAINDLKNFIVDFGRATNQQQAASNMIDSFTSRGSAVETDQGQDFNPFE